MRSSAFRVIENSNTGIFKKAPPFENYLLGVFEEFRNDISNLRVSVIRFGLNSSAARNVSLDVKMPGVSNNLILFAFCVAIIGFAQCFLVSTQCCNYVLAYLTTHWLY